ncbi:hypothetical protein [Actinoplanes solisilvae]|uniref:hypothetical protein n=1 Tax=Actinoplanes solisilvae TaxID=2486853 RepID=UPI000FD868A0|nr:hypothetical protein [Actinoplanes solisilvae]
MIDPNEVARNWARVRSASNATAADFAELFAPDCRYKGVPFGTGFVGITRTETRDPARIPMAVEVGFTTAAKERHD